MATHAAVCQSDAFWDACDWTTYDGTVIANATERDSYYYCRYYSLQGYFTGEVKDLPATEICEIIGPWINADAEANTGVWGTSPSKMLIVAAVGVARHSGKYPTGTEYRIESAVSNCLYVGSFNVIVDGLSARGLSSTSNTAAVNGFKSNHFFLDCVFIGGKSCLYASYSQGNGGLTVINCIAGESSSSSIQVSCPVNYPFVLSNCLVVSGAGYGGFYLAGYGVIVNCVVVDTAVNDYWNQEFLGSIYNCAAEDTSITTKFPSNEKYGCIQSLDRYQMFVDYDNSDYHVSVASPLRDAGIKISDVTPIKDITGSTYRDTVIDIGPFEYDTGYIPMLQVDVKVSGIAEGSTMAIYKTSDGTAIVSPTIIGASGSHMLTYDYVNDTQIEIVVRKGTSGTRYLPYSAPGLITENGFALIVNQVEDTIAI